MKSSMTSLSPQELGRNSPTWVPPSSLIWGIFLNGTNESQWVSTTGLAKPFGATPNAPEKDQGFGVMMICKVRAARSRLAAVLVSG
jgi:hypothetical protein